MKLNELTHRFCFRQIDERAIKTFLLAQKEDLMLDGEMAVQKVIDLLFEHGGILATFDSNKKIVALLGFFFGDPQQNFKNKDTMFLYVTAIAKPYRMTRLFFQGMLFTMMRGQEMGLGQFRMQANIHDPYVNKIYSRMGHALGEGKTLRGHHVITYGGSIAELLNKYGRNKYRTTATLKNNQSHTSFFQQPA